MNKDLRTSFFAWLKQQPDVSADSAKSYAGSYLTRVFKAWDSTADSMVPIENYVSVMIGNADYRNVLSQLCVLLEDKVLSAIKNGEISQRYGNNIRVSIHRFEEFVYAVVTQNKLSVAMPQNSVKLPAPQDFIKEISG